MLQAIQTKYYIIQEADVICVVMCDGTVNYRLKNHSQFLQFMHPVRFFIFTMSHLDFIYIVCIHFFNRQADQEEEKHFLAVRQLRFFQGEKKKPDSFI